jgi:hypothetical protein
MDKFEKRVENIPTVEDVRDYIKENFKSFECLSQCVLLGNTTLVIKVGAVGVTITDFRKSRYAHSDFLFNSSIHNQSYSVWFSTDELPHELIEILDHPINHY